MARTVQDGENHSGKQTEIQIKKIVIHKFSDQVIQYFTKNVIQNQMYCLGCIATRMCSTLQAIAKICGMKQTSSNK